MAAKIFPSAQARLLEIWDYTEKKWGMDQADSYVQNLVDAINNLQKHRRHWKPVRNEALKGVFFCRHRYHYIFFREFPSKTLGVISILHENMDIPSRLKEDAGDRNLADFPD